MVDRREILRAVESALLVGIGAFAGANIRYLFELVIEPTLLSTGIVNIVGCFALGVIVYEGQFVGLVSGRSQQVFGTGFLSSFTTYSTFVIDAVTASPAVGMTYVFGSYALGFASVVLGRETVRWAATGATPLGGS